MEKMDRKLNILLGNNTLAMLAGSESWTLTLALALKRLGHNVECFSPELGIIAEQLREAGIKCHDRIYNSGVRPFSFVLEEESRYEYDAIIANHNHIVAFLRERFPKTPIISTIHGIIHFMDDRGKQVMAPEHPALESGVQQFISVSEEVQDKLKEDYELDSLILRNFIDTKHFKPGKKFNKKPKQILFNSNYHSVGDPEVEIIREVAKHFKAKLVAVGQNFSTSDDPMNEMRASDIVIGMGRSVLEGLSAGKLGICFGRWGNAGVIHEGNIDEIRRFNFSGRSSGGTQMTAQELIAQINSTYSKKTLEWGRNYILREHNADRAAEFFVNMIKELKGEKVVDPSLPRPFKRAQS